MNARRFAWLSLVLMLAGPGLAQEYPAKPVRLVVPYPSGSSSNDIIARVLADRLSATLGQRVLVENRAGAGGIVGSEYVAKSPPDGYTLLVGTNGPQAIAPNVYKLNFDNQRDLAPVAMVANVPYVLVVHPSLPVRNMRELIALAKSRPGQLLFASSGNAGTPHLCWELVKSMAKIDIVHVPYKGGAPAMMDTVGGQTQMYCSGLLSASTQIKAGKLRAIGMATLERSPIMPELPTVAEQGLPGFNVASWFGIMAPANTPTAIVQRLYGEIAKITESAEMKKFLLTQGAEPMVMDPPKFSEFLRGETDKWAKVVRSAKLKLD
ncbi:MAG TPA: tripartite tricarboxylate transporter substrate binding protein [Burkholderiales bacterium]|nr:tripartite tricarboxylate transporter substrate binding protein [Burkholderiales bacterium]